MSSRIHPGTIAAALLLAASAAACQPPAASLVAPTIAAQHAYAVCPQAGELPPKDVTDAAVEVLRARLVDLGIQSFDIAVGACMNVSAVITDAVLEEAARAAVQGTGKVALYPVAADQVDQLTLGGAPPDGAEPLVETADFVSGEVVPSSGSGQPGLSIGLSETGATKLATWTQGHIGDSLALVVDGAIVSLPTINEPLTADFNLSAGLDAPSMPLATIAAMITSGPLPEEWAQPEQPQG